MGLLPQGILQVTVSATVCFNKTHRTPPLHSYSVPLMAGPAVPGTVLALALVQVLRCCSLSARACMALPAVIMASRNSWH